MKSYFTARMLGIHFLAVLAIVACFALSGWQWSRAHNATGSHQSTSSVQYEDVNPIGNLLPLNVIGSTTELHGTWDTASRFTVTERPTHGPSLINPNPGSATTASWAVPVGAWVIDELVLDDKTAVSVVRGWTPSPQDFPPASGEGAITGAIQPSEDSGYVDLLTLPDMITTSIALSHASVSVHDGYVVESDKVSGLEKITPIFSVPPRTHLHWRNVFYTGNWIFFAILVGAMWIRVVRDEVNGTLNA